MKLKKLFMILFASVFVFSACSVNENPIDDGGNQNNYHLYINEFMASNDFAYADEYGEYDDWIEIYNADASEVNIAGMYISDNAGDETQYQIPTGSDLTKIPAHGFIVLWADGQTEQGVLHLPFKLSSGGEDIVLTASDGTTTLDSHTYGPQETDISEGRLPDGADNWVKFSTPTPGASNNGASTDVPPVISNITINPDSTINPGDEVTVSAAVTDENDDVQSVTVSYAVNGGDFTALDMTAGNDSIYSVSIGSFADGSSVSFFVKAVDSKNLTAVSDTINFTVGYIPPVLYINEFMASNDTTIADENGEYDDWIEIYNPNDAPVNIGGFYITDDLTDLTAWQIPDDNPDATTIPAGGFLLLWADKDTDQGPLHVNLKLSGSGEQIGLTAPNGTSIIDSLTFGEQTTDVSYGRYPDGSDNWQFFDTPTPGASNN